MQHRMERRYFRVHGMLLLLSHENIEGPASLSPLLSSIMRKKEGTTEKYCCPLSERKEKDAYSTTNWKLNGKQGICLLLVPYIPVLKSFWMCLFHEVAFQMQKRKKNHTGRERNCGGREQWDRKRKQEILLYPPAWLSEQSRIFSA